MKAVVFNPENARPVIKKLSRPEPGRKEVIVQIHAAALNHRDINITRPGINVEFVYGSDGAGTIVQIGADVEGWKVGDEVIINSFITCMDCHHCLSGNHTLCEKGRVLGGPSWAGTFTEYVKIPAVNIELKPAHLTFQQAAVLPLSFGTAWRAMTTKANIQPGDTVFIQGIGGGVSLYCLQIAVALGYEVIVSSSSNEKIKKAREMGAVAGINYKEENVLDKVNELTNYQGFDIVLSSFGGSVPLSMDAAKIGGKIIQFAYLGDTLPAFEIDKIMMKQLTLIGTGDHTYQEFRQALKFINNTKLVPTVSNTFTLENFKQAFQLMKDGNQFGKIALTIDSDQAKD